MFPLKDLAIYAWWPGARTVLASLVLTAALFPFIRPFELTGSSDTQAWAALIAFGVAMLLVLGTRDRSVPQLIWLLIGFAMIALIDLVVRGNSEFGFRSTFGYFSVPLLAYVALKTYRHSWHLTLPLAVFTWLVVGVVQDLFDKEFAAEILYRLSTDAGRGITGLSPEPSFLAISALFMLLLNEFDYKSGRYGTKLYYGIILALLLLMLASSSGMGVLLITLFMGARAIAAYRFQPNRRFAITEWSLLAIAIVSMFIALQIRNSTSEPRIVIADDGTEQTVKEDRNRAWELLVDFLKDPIDLLETDGSLSERTSHIILSTTSLYESKGVGYGVGNWNDHALDLVASSPGWVQNLTEKKFDLGGRIMSGWGTAFFELGIVGVVFSTVVIFAMFRTVSLSGSLAYATLMSAVVVTTVMIGSVSLAFPTFGYIVGVHLVVAKHGGRVKDGEKAAVSQPETVH